MVLDILRYILNSIALLLAIYRYIEKHQIHEDLKTRLRNVIERDVRQIESEIVRLVEYTYRLNQIGKEIDIPDKLLANRELHEVMAGIILNILRIMASTYNIYDALGILYRYDTLMEKLKADKKLWPLVDLFETIHEYQQEDGSFIISASLIEWFESNKHTIPKDKFFRWIVSSTDTSNGKGYNRLKQNISSMILSWKICYIRLQYVLRGKDLREEVYERMLQKLSEEGEGLERFITRLNC